MHQQHGRGRLLALLGILILGGAVLYGLVVFTGPWALHIGGRWTPFLTWTGSGKLLTKGGEYPLYVSFFPSSHFSQLHMDGLRPTGGLQGSGWLCAAPGVTQRLELSGTIYGAWKTTDGSLMSFRLLEPRIINVGQDRGFFDLIGKWNGPRLEMTDRGNPGHPFSSGLRLEHASVTLDWISYSDFKTACEKTSR